MQNKFGITNDKGEIISQEYIRRFIQSYCRKAQYPHNRQANLDFLASEEFLAPLRNQTIGAVCRKAMVWEGWNSDAVNQPKPAVVTVVPDLLETKAPFWTSDIHPAPTSLTDEESFVWDFAEQMLNDLGIGHKLEVKSNRNRDSCFWYAGPKTTMIRFSRASISRTANGKYREYPRCEYLLDGYRRHGYAGLKCIVCHEVAHALNHFKYNGKNHDGNFHRAYAELLAKYAERA